MPETTHAYDFRGRTELDRDRQKIGKVDELYYDKHGGQRPLRGSAALRMIRIQTANPLAVSMVGSAAAIGMEEVVWR